MTIYATDEFEAWFMDLSEEETALVVRKVDLLEQHGVDLGYPHSSAVLGKIRELRVESVRHPIRIFYAFDARRDAVLLLGANKKGVHGEAKWTRKMAQKAETIFEEYLAEQARGEHKE